jgi:long-chain acyl-CoA synthetase
MVTLLDLLHGLTSWADRPAIVYRTGVRRCVFTYQTLHDLSLRMCGLLARHGIGPGDRVLVWAPNSPWWAVTFWGCMARKAVVVPVDFLSDRERAATIARLTDARLAVQSGFKPDRLTDSPTLLAEDLEFLLAGEEPLAAYPAVDPEETAQIIYTSGTTGSPKGVMLSHRNMVANLVQVNERIPIVDPDYVFLSLLPLSHMFEQMGGFLTPLLNGASVVYLRTLKPSAIFAAFLEEDIHAAICVPRLLQLMRSGIERELETLHLTGVFRRLQLIGCRVPFGIRKWLFFFVQRKFGGNFVLFVSGGAPLAPDLFRFWSILGFRVVEGYGLTECSPVLTANSIEKLVAGSVGTALAGVEIRIEDDEVLARGENVFSGYYRNEAATRNAFTPDGWFRTGDIGRLDPDGSLRILGRKKELIVTAAGVNVYPDEVEAILDALPGVRESCVLGLDRGNGEEVHAVLLLDGSGRSVGEIVREANDHLDPLQRITGFSEWPEPEFPKTTTLKIRKFLVKERIAKGREVTGHISLDRLTVLVARVTGAPVAAIREESFLVNDLGLTSIGQLELINDLEQQFRLDLEDSLVDTATTVADLRRIIARRERPKRGRQLRFWVTCRLLCRVRQFWDFVFHRHLLGLFVSIEASGLENLAEVETPVMFVANHLSYLDQPAIMAALPAQWRYQTATAAWEEFFFVNYRTRLGRLWKRFTYEYGTILLNLFPLSQTGGFRASLAHMGKLVDHDINILLFPEGARSLDGRLQPFRQGVGLMVHELGVPVVPIRIFGMDKIMPPGVAWPRRGRVRVCFGKSLECSGVSPTEIVERVSRAVEELE